MSLKTINDVIEAIAETRKPATQKQIEAFCKKAKFEPPKDYIEFVSRSNGGEIGGALDQIELYSLTDALKHTKDYDFAECAPDLVIIGTDGSGMAYCLDGRYRPARIIQTDLAAPGGIGDSRDFGTSFVGFIDRLMSAESDPAPGLPPLPNTAPADEIRRIRVESLGPIALGEDGQSIWVRQKAQSVLVSIPQGTELARLDMRSRVCVSLGDGRVACHGTADQIDFASVVDRNGTETRIAEGYFIGTTNRGTAVVVQNGAEKRVVDINTQKELHRSEVTAHYSFSPDGRWLIEHSDETKQLTLTDLQRMQVAWSVKAAGTKLVPDFIFSSDSQTIWGLDSHNKLFAWELKTGRLKFKCGDRQHPVSGNHSADFTEVPTTGDVVTCHGERGILVIWDGSTGTPKARHVVNEVKDGQPYSPRCTADGKYVVFGSQDGMTLWDISGSSE